MELKMGHPIETVHDPRLTTYDITAQLPLGRQRGQVWICYHFVLLSSIAWLVIDGNDHQGPSLYQDRQRDGMFPPVGTRWQTVTPKVFQSDRNHGGIVQRAEREQRRRSS